MLLDDLRAFARDPKGYPDSAAAHLCSNAADMIERLRASSHAQGARDQIEIRDGITDGYCDIINQTKKTTIGRVHLWNGTAQDLRDILVPASLTPAANDDASDAATLRGFIKEHGCTPSMVASDRDHWKRRAEQAEATIDLLERNASVQAKLLADTGRERDQALSQVENARAQAIEECAKFVEQHQETIRETSQGSERYLSPRKVNNLLGLAYVDGIRALSHTSTVRRPVDFNNAFIDEHGWVDLSKDKDGNPLPPHVRAPGGGS